MNKPYDKYCTIFGLSLIFIGVSVRFFDLAGQSAWWDEGLTLANVERDSFRALTMHLLTSHSSWSLQPAYYFILYLWLLVFDPSVAALRALSAIFGGLSVIVLMYGSWRTWGVRWMCLTGLFAAWSGYGIWYSQEIRPYSLSFLAVSLVLTCYLCSRTATDAAQINKWRFFLAIFSMLCVWVSILNVLFLSILAICDLLFHRSFKSWMGLWVPAAVASATYAVWLVPHFLMISQPQELTVEGPSISVLVQAGLIVSAIAVGRTFGPPWADLKGSNAMMDIALQYWPHFLFLGIALLAIILCTLIIFREKTQLNEARIKLAFVMISTFVLLLLFFVFLGSSDYLKIRPRHAFALFPLAALILPIVIYLQSPLVGRTRRLVGSTAVMLLVVLNIYSVFKYFTDPGHGRDDYRYVAQYIAQNADTLAVLGHGNRRTFSFYTDRDMVNALEFLPDDASKLNEIAKNWDKVVFIINRPYLYRPDAKPYLSQIFAPEFQLVDEISPHYFTMYLFQRVDNQER